MKAAYACVTWEYLEAHGDVVFPHRSVKRLDWVKVVAVLGESVSCPSRRH